MNSQERLRRLYEIFLAHPTVATDSRNISAGSIFFALRGKSFDGNAFAASALSRGAVLAVVDDPAAVPAGDFENAVSHGYFPVDDVLETLRSLAALHRRTLGIPVIAITGTNGKTTTKELSAAVLSRRFRTEATRGNLNNHIGVPLTLLSLAGDTQLAIVEMGASAPGEIAALCETAAPDYGIITNIGRAHLEGFGGEEGIRRTKGELYDYLASHGGRAFVRRDDPALVSMCEERPGLNIIWYDSSTADGIPSRLAGDYNRLNIAAAAAIGRFFGADDTEIREAVGSYEPTINRSQTIVTPRNTVIADCYNANPSSMKAAIEWFGRTQGPGTGQTMILGDMLELGAWSSEEHRAIIALALGFSPAHLVLVGREFCRALDDVDPAGIPAGTSVAAFADTDACLAGLKELPGIVSGRRILLKGSHGIALERLLPCL